MIVVYRCVFEADNSLLWRYFWKIASFSGVLFSRVATLVTDLVSLVSNVEVSCMMGSEGCGWIWDCIDWGACSVSNVGYTHGSVERLVLLPTKLFEFILGRFWSSYYDVMYGYSMMSWNGVRSGDCMGEVNGQGLCKNEWVDGYGLEWGLISLAVEMWSWYSVRYFSESGLMQWTLCGVLSECDWLISVNRHEIRKFFFLIDR